MSNLVPIVSFGDMERLAESIAQSGLFGMKTKDQALALMAISQAEGRHPALAARDYDIIQGRSAKKAEAMQRDFLEAGGKVEWHELTDTKADATFSHPAGGTVRITWDTERAKIAGLLGKDMYKKYPRQMLRSRVVSEGVRTVYPAATSGMYVPEEIADFDGKTINGTAQPIAELSPPPPTRTEPPHDPETGEIVPHIIAVLDNPAGGGQDWIAWGGKYIAALKQAKSREEGEKWIALNNIAMGNCQVKAPKAAGSVEKAILAMLDRTKPTIDAAAEPNFIPGDDEPDFIPAGDVEHA